MQSYNGHRSWAAWNVSLWINNDEGLYNLAKDCLRETRRNGKTRPALAANKMMGYLPTQTPDGAKYTALTVKLAIEEIEE